MTAIRPTTQKYPAKRLSALRERKESRMAAMAMIAGVTARTMWFFI
jgi:hypothetical protein